MEWLNDNEIDKREFKVLRLYAPEDELVLLDFCPLRESDEPDWNPMPEDWSCYPEKLRIYKQDYTQLLLKYFAVIYPTKDAFDGTPEPEFDVCSYNWIGKDDWNRIIIEIEEHLSEHESKERDFLQAFIEWVKEALKYTSIITVWGNQ